MIQAFTDHAFTETNGTGQGGAREEYSIGESLRR